MAHVAEWKKDLVKELVDGMLEYPVIAVVDVHGIAGQQIQNMRAKLRGHAYLKMTKNKLMTLAIKEAAEQRPGLEGILDAVHGQCAIIASDYSPFKLFKQLESTKTPAPAKAGQEAPFDIVIPKGPTPFGPGPIIGELQKIGLPAAIEAGKIVIKKDTTVVKSGEPIPTPVAVMLPKLGILPFIVGLDLRAAYEDGTVYHRDVLDIPDGYYNEMFAAAIYNARALAIEIVYPTEQTIGALIAKAYREAMALSIEAAIPTKDSIGALLAKADMQMLALAAAAGYQDDRISARISASAAPAAPAEPEKTDEKGDENSEEISEQEAEENTASAMFSLFG
ncbi:MAG: 50S ribosomal protein L10 [Candidatus Methanomethylophilaceae archaeon]|jgi:large subunit ribosomal protein L10